MWTHTMGDLIMRFLRIRIFGNIRSRFLFLCAPPPRPAHVPGWLGYHAGRQAGLHICAREGRRRPTTVCLVMAVGEARKE